MRERFQTLLAAHRGIVANIARAYSRDGDARRDLEQEIAAQAWQSFARFDEARGRFSTWLYRIALNVAISHLRRARTFEPLVDEPAALDDDDRGADLDAAIGALEPMKRALVLLYLDDKSHAEIAEILGITESNVAVKLHRIKQELRVQLREEVP